MLGWPGSAWGDSPTEDPPLDAVWRELPGEVRHTFTHFHLRLAIRFASLDDDVPARRGEFVKREAFRPESLPTVMRKVWNLAEGALPPL